MESDINLHHVLPMDQTFMQYTNRAEPILST